MVNQSLYPGSIKQTNWLLSKRMCVHLFDVFHGCSLVKNK